MSNETSITIITPRTLAEAKDMASVLAAAKTIPDALQKSPSDVLAIIMAGAELGLAPMQSVRALVLIKGKPTLSADAMVALVKSRRDRCKSFAMVESTPVKATYKTVEVDGDPAGTTISFTMAEATTAGIATDMYRKYPAQMLRARAKAALCREVYPDLLLGVYDPDELAPERDVPPPKASPPGNVVDSVATVVTDYDASGAPVSENAKLEVATNEAKDEAALSPLTARISALKQSDPKAYAERRAQWGKRRDEIKAKTAALHSITTSDIAPPEPGSEG